jgi:hypothetical protein
MSIGHLENIGLRRSILLAMWGIGFFFELSLRGHAMSSCMGEHLELAIFRASSCRCFILKKGKLDNLKERSSDGIFLVMLIILEHIVCSALTLTKS